MKKTTIMYECDNETHNSTVKAEGDLLEIIAGVGLILKDVSKQAAKVLDEDPAVMIRRISCAAVDSLMDERKGESNE